MKTLFLLLLSLCLLTACNNDGKNPFAKKDKTDKAGEKESKAADDKDERKQKENDDNTGSDDHGGKWTKSDKDKWMNNCLQVMENNVQTARPMCACMLDKAERKFRNMDEAENATEDEGKRLMRECSNEIKDAGGYDDNEDRTTNNSYKEDDNEGKSWTRLQREQYVQGCETGLRRSQPGYTTQQVHSYCDCMTRKVEQKHSFQEAARMTAADFQTREWQNAAADCLQRY